MNYYGDYEAHELINKVNYDGYDLGIEILLMKEPVFCNSCGHFVTENLAHIILSIKIKLVEQKSDFARKKIKASKKFMREEVSEALLKWVIECSSTNKGALMEKIIATVGPSLLNKYAIGKIYGDDLIFRINGVTVVFPI